MAMIIMRFGINYLHVYDLCFPSTMSHSFCWQKIYSGCSMNCRGHCFTVEPKTRNSDILK